MFRFLFACLVCTIVSSGCREPVKSVPETTIRNRIPALPLYAGEIPVPPGFHRIPDEEGSFTTWLRRLPLKKDKTVYLFNGRPKANQEAQYAVLDIPTGRKDLQQCADVIMHLRAAYLMDAGLHQQISFTDYAGKTYQWKGGVNRTGFDRYLEQVFSFCGSASLEKQLLPVKDFSNIKPGDLLIRGGFPGHAVLVIDLAVNDAGERMFMLLQGYQPAQDMHILLNPSGPSPGPWYPIPAGPDIYTPEWHFRKSDLRSWPSP